MEEEVHRNKDKVASPRLGFKANVFSFLTDLINTLYSNGSEKFNPIIFRFSSNKSNSDRPSCIYYPC